MRKFGIVFGSFQPFHKGHLSLVLKAKHECEKVYILCCGYNNDIRDSRYDLPLDKRFRLVREFFKDDPLIEVRKLNDSEMGIDGDVQFTDKGWAIWLNKAISPLPFYPADDDNQFIIYTGEESYKNKIVDIMLTHNELGFIGTHHVKVELVDRSQLPISGTMIRDNPLKYWKYIIPTFRREFSVNILVTGTASEGKTNLVNDISKYFNLVHSEEMAREVLRKNGKIGFDNQISAADFSEFLIAQHNANRDLINSPVNSGIFIADSDNAVTLMYARQYAMAAEYKKNYAIDLNEFCCLKSQAEILNKGTKWNVIFLTTPKDNFVDDGERNKDQASLEERQGNYETLKEVINGLYPDVEIIELDGNYEENFNIVKEYIEKIYMTSGLEIW